MTFNLLYTKDISVIGANKRTYGMKEERRRHKRHILDPQPRLIDLETREEIGHVYDITPQGMKIIAKTGYKTDQILQLLILLDKQIFGKESFAIEGRCAWSKPAADPQYQTYGVDFTDVSPHDTGLIAALMFSEEDEDDYIGPP